MTDRDKLTLIKVLLRRTRRLLNRQCEADREYTTIQRKGVNCWEASDFFKEIEQGIEQILNH